MIGSRKRFRLVFFGLLHSKLIQNFVIIFCELRVSPIPLSHLLSLFIKDPFQLIDFALQSSNLLLVLGVIVLIFQDIGRR